MPNGEQFPHIRLLLVRDAPPRKVSHCMVTSKNVSGKVGLFRIFACLVAG